ncbi:MAG: hypothetical protein SF182_09915 [Deltaproteobacteria bacterium]|nr:hypothetical protein [Deltaproteobacteria bacterium]
MAGLLAAAGAEGRIDPVSLSTAGSAESPADDSAGYAGSAGEFLPSDGATLQARLRFNANADVGAGQVREQTGAFSFTVTFRVETAGPHRVVVESSVLAEITRHADSAACRGSAAISGVLGFADRPLESGALGFGPSVVLPDGGGEAAQEYRAAARASFTAVPDGGPVTYELTYVLSATAISRGCEVAVRGGAANGTTLDCTACGYPGAPARAADGDGIAVRISVEPLCGDGAVSAAAGEQCDLGARNGTDDSCCTSACRLREAGSVCRADDNPCTADACNGSEAECMAAPQAGACDDGVFCNGADACDGGTCSRHAGSPCPQADGDGDCRESCDEGRDACDAADAVGSACAADDNPCTADACDGQGACVGVPRAGSCDDGDACTSGDACVDGLCRAGGPTCDACQTCANGACSGASCTPTPTATSVPTSTATPDPACAGDCAADGAVTVSELVTMVGIALGATGPDACGRGDSNGDGAIGIAELVAAVNALLDGCNT